jgi:hypothetical protein
MAGAEWRGYAAAFAVHAVQTNAAICVADVIVAGLRYVLAFSVDSVGRQG